VMTVATLEDERTFQSLREDPSRDAWPAWADEHPLALDRDGYPLELGARLRHTESLDVADPAYADAAVECEDAIGRHEGLVGDATLGFFRPRVDALFAAEAITPRDRERRARIRRRGRILDGIDLRALDRAGDDELAPRSREVGGERFDYWIAAVPGARGTRTARLVLVLDRAAFDADLGERIAAFGPRQGAGLRAVRLGPGETTPGPGPVLAMAPLPAPFDDVRVAVVADDEGVLEQLADLESGGSYYLLLVVIGLSIVGIIAAAVVTLRTVSGELKLAKRTSDFVSSVTHELKTPLTAIRVFVETLQDGRVRDDEERDECLAVIAKETDRLQERIERVLQFAKLESGRVSFERRAADLAPVLREMAETFRARLGDRPGAVFRADVDGMLGPVRFDRIAIEEAVMNLLANGKKYSPPDRCELTLAAVRENGAVRISVSDHGIGLPAGEKDRIFDKFYRVDDRRVQEVEGTGLGLALVRDIVEAHEGRITVESRPGQGSTFTIHLPLATDDGEV